MAAQTSTLELTPRPVAGSVEELLAGVSSRQPFVPDDLRSPTSFERVVIDGERFVLKHVSLDSDFTMRVSGDIGCRPLRAWAAGLMDVVPEHIDHAVLAAAAGDGRNGWGAALLMRDLTDELVPVGDEPVPEAQHLGFLESLAALSARMWGWRDDLDLLPHHYRWWWFAPICLEGERALGWPERVPQLAAEGWERFAARVPASVSEGVFGILRDPTLMTAALADTPSTFLHGDWKFGNLGTAKDGRTVLIDWAYPGEGPVCHELAWYLAINRARLPIGHTKETTIDAFRSALERAGVDTAGWWERQLAICLLGALLEFGWEKAYGPDDELGWWCDRAVEGLRCL